MRRGAYTTLTRRKLKSVIVLEHAAKGLSIRDIVEKTGYGHGKVEAILAGINTKAAQEMSYIIQTRIPLEYEKSLVMLEACLKRCWEIDGSAKDQYVSLQAINTILKIQDSKAKLLADSAMISRAIQKAALILPVKHSKTTATAQLKDAGENLKSIPSPENQAGDGSKKEGESL